MPVCYFLGLAVLFHASYSYILVYYILTYSYIITDSYIITEPLGFL